jgi:FliI/YscN family ATPase
MSHEHSQSFSLWSSEGRVCGLQGPLILAQLPLARLGSMCEIEISGGRTISGTITSCTDDSVRIAPLEEMVGISIGSRVRSPGVSFTPKVPRDISGCVLGATGEKLNEALASPDEFQKIPLNNQPPKALERTLINNQLITGITAIDCLVPIGYGQRLSLSAPAGTGKSTLLATLTQGADIDHTVIALIGERGREVGEFVSHTLGEEGLNRSTVIVATSDEVPIRKVLASDLAFSIAESLRLQGKRVLLIVDSLTRLARAMRDVGLANGELPVRQGYPASVLIALPRLLERAGATAHGSITLICSLLAEENSGNDYLCHEIASLLDGHLVLDPHRAARGLYPALDPLQSLSRLSNALLSSTELSERAKLLTVLGRLERDRDLALLGGTIDPELKHYLNKERAIDTFLTQERGMTRDRNTSQKALEELNRALTIE